NQATPGLSVLDGACRMGRPASTVGALEGDRWRLARRDCCDCYPICMQSRCAESVLGRLDAPDSGAMEVANSRLVAAGITRSGAVLASVHSGPYRHRVAGRSWLVATRTELELVGADADGTARLFCDRVIRRVAV